MFNRRLSRELDQAIVELATTTDEERYQVLLARVATLEQLAEDADGTRWPRRTTRRRVDVRPRRRMRW